MYIIILTCVPAREQRFVYRRTLHSHGWWLSDADCHTLPLCLPDLHSNDNIITNHKRASEM